jgi:hypothetical protein
VETVERKIAYPLRPTEDDTWERLHRIAEAAMPEVRRRFLDAIARIRGAVDEHAVEAALARGDISAVMHLIPFHDLDDTMVEVEAHLDIVRDKAFTLARDVAKPALDPQQVAIHLGSRPQLTLSFRHVSLDVLNTIRTQGATRIKAVSENTRQAVRASVERAFVAGQSPKTIVKEIQQIVGLTPKMEQSVTRYRKSLEASEKPIKPERIERMVAKVTAKRIKQRAEMIARTETIQAMNEGQRASWRTMVERGFLDGNAWEREWMAIVPTDGRTCPICIPFDGIRAPIDGDYEPADAKGGPPQHPDCRCTERLVQKNPAPVDAAPVAPAP